VRKKVNAKTVEISTAKTCIKSNWPIEPAYRNSIFVTDVDLAYLKSYFALNENEAYGFNLNLHSDISQFAYPFRNFTNGWKVQNLASFLTQVASESPLLPNWAKYIKYKHSCKAPTIGLCSPQISTVPFTPLRELVAHWGRLKRLVKCGTSFPE